MVTVRTSYGSQDFPAADRFALGNREDDTVGYLFVLGTEPEAGEAEEIAVFAEGQWWAAVRGDAPAA